MEKIIPWHSDLDRNIGLFLAENRDMSSEERLIGVYMRILRANLDAETLLHYAACMFVLRDGMAVEANKLPQILFSIVKSTKGVADHIVREQKSKAGKAAADAGHSKPGKSREKQDAIRDAWASGKYSNRDLCAEQECAALNMAFGTARRALRNTPEPPRCCIA